MSIKLTPRTAVTFTCSWCEHEQSELAEGHLDDPDDAELPNHWAGVGLALSPAHSSVPYSKLVLCPSCSARLMDLAQERIALRQSQTPELDSPPDSFSDATRVGPDLARCGYEAPNGMLCCLPAEHSASVPHQFTRKP